MILTSSEVSLLMYAAADFVEMLDGVRRLMCCQEDPAFVRQSNYAHDGFDPRPRHHPAARTAAALDSVYNNGAAAVQSVRTAKNTQRKEAFAGHWTGVVESR